MNITINYVPAFFMLIGVLMYALSANPKVVRIGEMLFFAGALAFALGTNGFGVHLKD